MVSPEKIAVCLNCGNEWEVREAGAKKRKCPVCGKYRVKMKSEMAAEELQAVKGGHSDENSPDNNEKNGENEEKSRKRVENSPKKNENSPEEKTGEKEEEKTEENRGGALLLMALVVVAAGSLWFLWSAVRARRAENVDSEEEMRRYGVWA